MKIATWGAVSLFLLLAACTTTTPERPVEAIASERYFVMYVKPILESRCVSCHQGANPPAGLSLVQRSGLYAPRRHGRAYVVPGDPAASLLLTAVEPGGSHPRTIPRVADTLSDYELGALYEWIQDGAAWPDGVAGFLRPVATSIYGAPASHTTR